MTFLGRCDNQARICRAFEWITFFTFWLSASAYGLPIQFDASNVINLFSVNGREARSGGDLNSLGINGAGRSHLLYGSLDSAIGGSLHSGSYTSFNASFHNLSSRLLRPGWRAWTRKVRSLTLLAEITEIQRISADGNGMPIRCGAMADFLAGIDFLTTDWHAESGHSAVAAHEAPAPPAPAIIRRNPRECLQGNHEPKRGVQESLCTEGSGLAGSGVRSSSGGSSGSSAAFLAGAGGASGNSRNVIGVGDGIGGGGGGAGGAGGGGGGAGGSNNSGGGTGNNGTGNEGGDKGDGSPGGSSGIGNGGDIGQSGGAGAGGGNGTWDQGGNGGSGGGGAAEVRPVPEPVSLALVALGFAGMCFVRSHSRAPGAPNSRTD